MIRLTFYYTRDVFTGDKFKKWITDLFGENVRYDGSDGRRFAKITISMVTFEENKDKIPTKNLVGIEGGFNVMEQLAFGVRDFTNKLTK